jgi:hypothetical protein
MAKIPSEQKPGCFKKLFIGLGCGCLYPTLIFFFIIGISYFYLANAFSEITRPIDIPQFAAPDQETYWTLQEKRLERAEKEKGTVELTPSEANALLSFISLPPINGFCLQRLRFLPGENQGSLYIIGSGFFLRSLVFVLELKFKPQGPPEVMQIRINRFKVPARGLVHNLFVDYLKSIFSESRIPALSIIKDSATRMLISPEKILIPDILIRKGPDQ